MAWGLVFQLALGSWPHQGARAEEGAKAPPARSCDVAADVSRLPEVLASVRDAGGTPGGCAQEAEISGPLSARLGCPHRLIEQIARDGKAGFLKESPSEACRVAITRALQSSPAEIESRLARHPVTSLSGSPDLLQKSCPNMAGEAQKFLAAEYYLDMTRLKQAEISSYEMLASLDSVLGRQPLQDLRCGDSRLPELDATCVRLQSCPAAGGLKEQAEELAQVWPIIEKLEGEIQSARASISARAMSSAMSYGYMPPSSAAQLDSNSATLREKSAQLDALQSMYPALQGKEFRKRFDAKKKNFEEALQAQLEATRARLAQQQSSYRRATECLNSPLGCGLCDDYEKTLAGSPELDSSQFRAGAQASKDEIGVQAYLAAADCRQKLRGFRSEAGTVVGDFAIGAGLTIATAGLGTIAAGAKATTSVAQGARAATVAGRVGEVLAKPLIEVSVSARSAALARNAILGLDLFWAGEGVQKALSECDALLSQLEPTGATGKQAGAPEKSSASSLRQSSLAQSSSCPGGGNSPEVQLMADYRACALSAFLNVTPNLLPFAPKFVAAYRAGKRSLTGVLPQGSDAVLRAKAAARLERETGKRTTRALLAEELAGVAGGTRPEWIHENVKPAFERAAAQRKAWTEFEANGLRRGERVHWVQQREIKELNEKLWNMGGTERYLATVDEEVAAVLAANPKLGRLIHQNYKDRVIVSKLSPEELEARVLAPSRERAAEKMAGAFSTRSDPAKRAEIRNAWREWIRQSTDVGTGQSLMEAHLAKNPQIRAIQQQKGVSTLEAYSEWQRGASRLRTRVDEGLSEAGITVREAFLMLKRVDGSTAGMARMLENRGMSAKSAQRVASLVVDYRTQLSVGDVLPLPKKLTPIETKRLEFAAKGDYQQAHRLLSDSWVFERNLAFSKAPDAGVVVALDVQGLGIDGMVARDEWVKRGARLEELPEIYSGTSAQLEERMQRVREGIEEITGSQAHLYQSGDDALILIPPVASRETLRQVQEFVANQPSLYSAVESIPSASLAARRSEDIAESIHRVRERLFRQKDKGEVTTALEKRGLREAGRLRPTFNELPPGGRLAPARDASP
jgi:hypothetical protein